MRMLALLPLLMLALGCTRYEYDLLQPADWSRHIGTDIQTLDDPPLAYHLQSYDNRLVLRIENRSDAPVKLLSDGSWLVRPDGQSLPLHAQTIAPRAFIKLVLPPMAPRYQRRGPTIGFGIGASSGGSIGTGIGVGTTLGRDNIYMVDEDAYWDWPADTTVRLQFTFEPPDAQPIERALVLIRKKM